MRILVLGDIHSNWSALRAIEEDFDYCLFTGDLVDYGTNPLPCIDWVRRNVNVAVRGNHDHAVAQRVNAQGTSGYRRLAAATRPLHWDSLDSQRLKFLARLPVVSHLRVGLLSFQIVHATPRDPLDEHLGPSPELWKQRLANVDSNIVCVGHTHTAFHLDVDGIQVLNPGSVGQPRDGDPRASYAIIQDGQIELHRVEYDIDEAVQQVRETNLPEWVVRLNEAIWRTGGQLSKDEMNLY